MRVFTVGQIAKICQVAPRTVSKWIDLKYLEGFTIPAKRLDRSGDRRVTHESLCRFLKENGMPMRDLGEYTPHGELKARILIVSHDAPLVGNLARRLRNESATVHTAEGSFEAGAMIQQFAPDCVIVDFDLGPEATPVCRGLRQDRRRASVILIALLPHNADNAVLEGSSVNESFAKPFDPALLAERLKGYVGSRRDDERRQTDLLYEAPALAS